MSRSGLGAVLVSLALAGLAATASAKATIAEKTVEGQTQVVLENEFIRIAFTPTLGGECTECVYKPADTSFVEPRAGALIGNRVWNYANDALYSQWRKLPWSYEIQPRKGEVALLLRAAGKENFTHATTFERLIVLRDDEAMVRITYTFSVGQELMVPEKIGLWFFNMPRVSGEQSCFTLPLDTGVRTVDPTTGAREGWFYNPARGWGAISGPSGAGLCFNMEYRRLMCFYSQFGGDASLEWAFRTLDIKNGESFSTQALLIPFAGIKSVCGSGNGVVAGFEAPDRPTAAEAQAGLQVRALLTSGSAQSGELVVSLRRLPSGELLPVHRTKLALKPGEVAAVNMTATPPAEGTWLLVGQFLRDGQEVMDFIRPVIVGKESGPVRIEAKEARLGVVTERFEDRAPLTGSAAPKDMELSMAVETPHVKWAKPYRGGKLKVLVLTDYLTGREAVELAQRLDMELLWVTAGSQYELDDAAWLFGKAEGSYRVEHMNEYIKQCLTRPCDAVIIGGISAGAFTDEVIELLRKKVNEGMGLVYVTPVNGSDKLYSFLPVEKESVHLVANATWSAAQQHYITNGVPLAALPDTGYALYKATGQVLATVGAAPLIVTQEGPGKGRVAVFTYNTSWAGPGSYSTGITPWIEGDTCTFKYWEYYFSMLSKALIWVSRKEQPAMLKSVTADFTGDPQLVISLDNAGDAIPAKASLSISDAYGVAEASAQGLDAPLPKGDATIRLKLPETLAGGRHFADVILKDPEGRVITWGSAMFRTPEPVKIAKISFDNRAYYPGDTARATVTLTAGDPAHPVLLSGQFVDALDRVLFRIDGRKLEDVKQTTVTFDLPIGRPLATTATFRVTAYVDERPASVAQATVITFPERFAQRGWDDWHGAVWGNPTGSYVREYLVPGYAKAYHDYGISSVFSTANWRNAREYEWPIRAGFQIMPMSVSQGYINVGHVAPEGKLTFVQQQQKYQETHDKKYLVRPVCLNSEADLEPLAKQLRELADYCGWLEPIGYNLGDEMSTTYYLTPFDYDFHPDALAAFRIWLKERYTTLDALNKEWDAHFATWDAVMPMTALEVKARANYAPWADHRQFMEVSFARFFDWTRDRLRERDPRARIGLSGSQAAEAYGGYDWSLVIKSFDFIQNYTHCNTSIMQRSFGPNVPRAPWYGYGWRNPELRGFLWRCLLDGNMGGSYFNAPSMLRPDLLPSECAADARGVSEEFQRGLAKLLGNCPRISDIGIHYSQPSIRGAYITGSEAIFRDDRAGWISAVEDLGFQCELLSSSQLEAGELAKRNYRAFILPCSVALSDKEAAALRQYVEAGGLLIADAKLGLMDEHCKTRSKSLLEELFGISRDKVDPSVSAREGEARFTRDSGQCKLSDLRVDVSVAEPELRTGDGEAFGIHGRAPVAVVRKAGKGVTVFLNFFMDSYPQRRGLNIETPLRNVLANLLRLNGVEPSAKVEIAGDPKAHLLTVRYRNGNALCIAAMREYDGKQADTQATLNLAFPTPGFVYDLRQGKALGRSGSAASSVLPGEAAVFAVMPYEVKSVAVAPKAASAAAGAPVQYEVSIPEARGQSPLHILLVEVLGPDGNARPHYGAKLVASDGKAAGEFVPAFNDPPGRWTIRATDFISRVSGVATVELRP